ncbi:T9SS type A sorting domain-containing protein [Prolixibacteraceae bacterium JC049]|nr:T9SS type A sorting domain-containing protein [Prolixibacteraceae bacterium JC049]
MRKLFTRLFSIFILISGLGFQAAFGALTWDGTKSKPVAGNLNVKPADVATKFVVAFNEAPQLSEVGGTLVLYKGTSTNWVATIPVSATASNVSVVGKTLEVTHGQTIEAGVDYYIALLGSAVKNFGEISATSWRFKVGDYVAPVLKTAANDFTPAKGAKSIDARDNAFHLVIPFNENIAKGTGNVTVYAEDGTVVDIVDVASADVTIANNEATVQIANSAIFNELTKYYVQIDANAFKDVSGNDNKFAGLKDKTTFTFTTRDYSAPVVSAVTVTNVTTTSATLGVTINEKGKYYYLLQLASVADPADANAVKTGGVAVTVNAPNAVVTTAMTVAGSNDYEVFVVAENAETPANLTTTVKKVTFSSDDNTRPAIFARGIMNNDAKRTTGAYLLFDEQVRGGSGELALRLDSDESYVKRIDASTVTSFQIPTGQPNAGKWKVAIDFEMTLPSEVAYYIVFPETFIEDMAGNNVTGAYINRGDWNFVSSDFELPVVTFKAASWASNKVSDLNSDLWIQLDEVVTVASSTNTAGTVSANNDIINNIYKYVTLEQAGKKVQVLTASHVTYDNTNKRIVINPTNALTSNTAYTVKLAANAIKDANGNVVATEKVGTLTTGDLDAIAASYGSSEGVTTTTGLKANSTLKIKFNKAVRLTTTGTPAVTAENIKPFITFTKGGANKAFTVTYDAASFTVTVIPTDALVTNATDYAMSLNTAKIEDVNGVDLGAGVVTTNYSIADFTAPAIALSHTGNVENKPANANPKITITDLANYTDLNGANLAANVSNHVVFKADNASGENLAFTVAVAGDVITITPTVALATGKTYYYGIGASVKDASGNIVTAKLSTFTMTAPAVAPVITAQNYTINASAETAITAKVEHVVPVSNKLTLVVKFNDLLQITNAAASNPVTLAGGNGAQSVTINNVSPNIVSGNTVRFEFPIVGDLDSETEYTVTLPAGIVQGQAVYNGTDYAQFAGKTFKFKSKDIVKPTVSAHAPTGTGVALNGAMTLNFSEKVELGSGNIQVKIGNTVEQTIAINSTNVKLNSAGTTATITHADFVKYNTTYTVVIPKAGFHDDGSNNAMAADYTYTFTTLLNPQPTVATYLPADEADLVALDSPITLTFSEEVEKNVTNSQQTIREVHLMKKTTGAARASLNAGTNYSLNLGDDVKVASMYVDNSNVSVSGKTVTLNFGVNLEANTDYYILIGPDAFKDKSTGNTAVGNEIPGTYAGILTYGAWNFTTKDVKAPSIQYAYTKRGDDKVAMTSDIVITFSKPIMKANGDAINSADVANLFTLTKTSGTNTGVKAFVGTINATKTVVTVLNSSLVTLGEFTELSNYTIALNTNAIKSTHGGILSGSDNFTTSDYTKPVVVVDFANNVSDIKKDEATARFTVTDNSMLKKVYYTITAGDNNTAAPAVDVIKANGKAVTGGSDVETNKFTSLTSETSYVIFSVVEDKAGNLSTVAKKVFTTDDVTKPELVTASLPANFDANKKLTLTFNEDVTADATAQVRVVNAATLVTEATLTLHAVANKPKQLITSAFTGLASDVTSYYIEVEKGHVMDVPVVAGDAVNLFDGHYGNSWMVTATDVTAPMLLTVSPNLGVNHANPAMNFDVNSNVTLAFNENMKLVTPTPASAITIEEWNGTAYVPFEVVDPANITITDKEVVINPARTLKTETQYRFAIKANVFADMAGNKYATAREGFVKTSDVVAPTVTFAPANAATNVALGTPMTITFSEALKWMDGTEIDYQNLQSAVQFKKNGTAAAFTATLNGAKTVITITPATALVKDANYTLGVVANKFEDAAGNEVAAAEATFATPVTPSSTNLVSILPNNNDNNVNTPATIDQVFTIQFTGAVYTYNTTASLNNLPVTPAYLGTAVQVTVNGAVLAANKLTFTISDDNRTATVTPKEAFASDATVRVELIANKLQVGEGNTNIISAAVANMYTVEDVRKPILDAAADAGLWENGYYPAKVTNLSLPASVIAKTDALKLTFDEKVKAGTGAIEIRRWDGVLVKEITDLTFDATKKIVTIGDLTGIPTNVEYYVVVPAGAIVDLAGNQFAGIAGIVGDAQNWRFLLKDDAIPQVTYTPTTTNIPVTTDLVLNFDRPVAEGDGFVAIYKENGEAIELLRTADVNFAMSNGNRTATVDISNLEVSTVYQVQVAEGTFVSQVDNTKKQAAIAVADWTFTTESNTTPKVVADGFSPAKDATTAPLNSDLEITFDMDVQAGSGNIQLHSQDGSILLNFDVTGDDVTFNGNVVTVDLPKLAENKTFYVIIPGTAIRNTSVTPEYYAGITVPYVWQFSTLTDETAPTLTVTDPATPVAATFEVGLEFSEDVTGVEAGVTANTGTVTVTKVTDAQYTVQVEAAEKTEVVLTIANTITDKAVTPNAFAGKTLTYTTGDFTAPTATIAPASGDIAENAFDVTVTFSEEVVIPDGAITVEGGTAGAMTNEGNVYTIPVTTEGNATVVVTVPTTVEDTAGNAIAEAVVATYKVGDYTAPTVSADPASGTDMAADFNVTLTFSEEVKGTDGITVEGATATVTGSGTTYTVAVTGAADAATVTITVPATVTDMAGNAVEETVYTYTVGDNTAPTMTANTPVSGTTLTDNHPVFTMTFSEDVVLGTGAIKIVKVGETDATLELDPAAAEVVAEVTGTQVTVTYDLASGLDKNTEYYVLVPEGFVKDAANNNFAGVTDNTAWTFTTGAFKTGVEPGENVKVAIYPNPFKSEINISNTDNLERVVISNIAGQVVKQVVNPTSRIETSNLRTGVYFITLYSNAGVVKTERIVKR